MLGKARDTKVNKIQINIHTHFLELYNLIGERVIMCDNYFIQVNAEKKCVFVCNLGMNAGS